MLPPPGTAEVPSRDCSNEGMAASSVGGVLESLASTSAGIARGSSRECCDEGTTSSSRDGAGEDGVVEDGVVEDGVGEDGVVEDGVVGGGVAGISGCIEGVTSSYPDPPSVSMISGAPSIEFRRDWMAAVALV